MSRAHILKEAYHLQLLDIPPPTQHQLGPSRDEWCEFHRATGHSTKECQTLKNQIERLIQESCLRHFIKTNERKSLVTEDLPERDRSRTLGRRS
ncbi:hypothetical protein CR513_17688, partial [Mucuna pruriens]